jgi:molybdopterin/thiamine biosynthesis adenylyltransferase
VSGGGRIAVVGCGGLGVPAAWTLALGGVHQLRLIDADTVELSNLHRQVLYTTADIGQSKAATLAAVLRARVAEIEVVQDRLDAHNAATLLDGCDAVFEGSDDAACKFAVNDWAIARPRRRYAVIAAAIGRRGQWMQLGPATACYRCLFGGPPPAETLATCQIAGVLGPAVGLSAALAARSLLAALQGRDDIAHSALVRWTPRGLLRTAVQADPTCRCQEAC